MVLMDMVTYWFIDSYIFSLIVTPSTEIPKQGVSRQESLVICTDQCHPDYSQITVPHSIIAVLHQKYEQSRTVQTDYRTNNGWLTHKVHMRKVDLGDKLT